MPNEDEEEDEEPAREERSTEYDIELTRSIISRLQSMGQNVLIDDFLVNRESDDEWDAERLLDVLISLQVAGIENHRGIHQRTSRAFTYRTGYADPNTQLHKLAADVQLEVKRVHRQRERRCKRLRAMLDSDSEQNGGDEEVRKMLKAYYEDEMASNNNNSSGEEEVGEDDARGAGVLQRFLEEEATL